MNERELRNELLLCFDTALAAVRPGAAVAGALDLRPPPAAPPRLLAVGKAAVPMARAAAAWLGARGIHAQAGLVVAPLAEAAAGLPVLVGDHPLPGPGSAAAADAIATFARATPPGAEIWFLLSGGATSLMAGPETGLSVDDLRGGFDQLLRSGLDIRAMNLVRKRLTRWGGGKLAAALAQARVVQFVVSDVPGDVLEAIGSGPAAPDSGTARETVALVDRAGLRPLLPPAVVHRLDAMAAGDIPDLPPPDSSAFARVETVMVAANRMAVGAAAEAGRVRGWTVEILAEPLAGEAAEVGRAIAHRLLDLNRGRRMLVAGGETTVRLPPRGGGLGGRNQELALAAAQVLSAPAYPVAVLAGGTDGRDGPTDAAGGLVDRGSWARMKAAGVDPERALAEHDAYAALDASGDLLRTGPTGTNVMDVVIAAAGD